MKLLLSIFLIILFYTPSIFAHCGQCGINKKERKQSSPHQCNQEKDLTKHTCKNQNHQKTIKHEDKVESSK